MNNILNKKQFYKLWLNGALGNKINTWNTYKELIKSGHKKPVGLRSINQNNRFCFLYVNICDIKDLIKRNHLNEKDIIYCEHAPDGTNLIMNGELCELPDGLYLNYNTEMVTMRQAIPNFKSIQGLKCKLYLKEILNPNSYNDLMFLINEYPDHIIELSVYNIDLGFLPNQNMIIWEVRRY